VVGVQVSAELRPLLIVYLNRLSDLLFVMARHQNQSSGVADVAWAPRASAPA
jgi:cob(I)alamin adenosyltransferase